MATVDIHYVKALLSCSQRKGHSIESLMFDTGITSALLEQPDARVYGEQMSQLVKLTWDLLQDEFMGCTQHPCKQGVFALMARHALHYESLQAVLEQGIHFYNLFTDDIQMSLVCCGDLVELKADFKNPHLDPEHFYQEFWLVIWHRFASWIIGKKIPLIEVCFPYAKPVNFKELKDLFPCNHLFNRSELTFSFSADYLACSPVRTQHDLSRFLKYSPADLITIPGEEQSYKACIRSILLYQKSEVLLCPSFEQLAIDFNVSSQTLRRKLKNEGTSYPQIKEDIRRDLAIEKLCSQKLSVSEIARLLGFSEPRSFSRAFKQWTGLMPKIYLKENLQKKCRLLI
jgi:AraC-like DNA-binding protein